MLGTEGVRLAMGGDCAGAISKLQGAEKLYHAPVTAEWLGECQVNVGKVVAGTEILNGVVREVLAPNAPAAFTNAQKKAREFLPGALTKIAHLKIHVDGAPADKVAVTVDGERVPSVLLDGDRPTDPGQHEVKAAAEGFKTAASQMTLAPGGSGSASLKLDPEPSAQRSSEGAPGSSSQTTAASGPVSSGEGAPPAHGHNYVPAYVSFGVGGAGVVLGAITGFMALGTKGSLDSACNNGKVCPGSEQGNINSLNTQAWVSTIGFGVGIVGAAAGVVLLVTAGPSSESAPAPKAASRGVHVTPWFSGNALGVGGTFE
jgi:hypothetical protein